MSNLNYNNPKAKSFILSLSEDKCDPKLGMEIRNLMIEKGLEQVTHTENYSPGSAVAALEEGVREAFKYLGLDPQDPSTKETPRRYAAMVVGELTKGLNYDFFPKCTATPNGNGITVGGVRIGAHNQMVLVKNCQTMSLCEHHLQTIDGMAHVAYIPNTRVLGLSKFARVVEFFSRRPQIQERMTDQIYYALAYILETEDVAVVVDAVHYCMRARGAMQSASRTQTNKVGGRFMSNTSLRQEFLDAIR